MSIYPLLLDGWEQQSTWGAEDNPALGRQYYYAQLTRDGRSDDGPEFWITPPKYPAYPTTHELGQAISRITGAAPETVLRAMAAGAELLTGCPVGVHGPQASQSPQRVYLDVPYAEKDAAKAAGARWDPTAKRWHDPRPITPGLQRWAARPAVPDVLPGEDRTYGQGLFVDLVPRSCWFTNVRTCVSQQDWERLRRMIVGRARHACEICGAGEDRTAQRWLEAHERWAYNEAAGVQVLRRLICLCSPCHLVTHFGHADVAGRTAEAFAHLRAVTGMSNAQASEHVRAAERTWITRSS